MNLSKSSLPFVNRMTINSCTWLVLSLLDQILVLSASVSKAPLRRSGSKLFAVMQVKYERYLSRASALRSSIACHRSACSQLSKGMYLIRNNRIVYWITDGMRLCPLWRGPGMMQTSYMKHCSYWNNVNVIICGHVDLHTKTIHVLVNSAHTYHTSTLAIILTIMPATKTNAN